MTETAKALKYLDYFSLLTVGRSKVPNFTWTPQQIEKLSKDEFVKRYNYKGGTFKKNNQEIPATENIGLITGFDFLEVIDIDLKVFSTAKEKIDFWNEYLGFLKDNILDFEEKFVIYKTKNEGYHILYKSKRIQSNLKLAKLKGHKEAVIETRGRFGYVFAYPHNKVSKNGYFDVKFISDEDREILITFSKSYNYQEPEKEIKVVPKQVQNIYKDSDVQVWDDFNNKTNVWDVIGNDFTIIANHDKKYIIKRHGSDAAHSGYIFKDNDILMLYSTGTVYPHEKGLSAFACYTYKNHNGDFATATLDLYEKGFGSRRVLKETEPEEKILLVENDLQFPIDIFTKPIQSYIIECANTLNMSIDYMGCSLMWLMSLSIGNSMKIEVKKGWIEIATLWIAVVGKAGIGKTPSISKAIFPLEKLNNKEISNYIKKYEKWDLYDKLTKKEKEDYPDMEKPLKKQFIANDITLEALIDLHQENDNAVGVFKDELAGWFKDMNKYKAGSDLEFWLSSWSGKSVNLNRMTRAGSFVASPLIPILGGIQPGIFNSFYTNENKDNGFMDRMLLSYPDLKVEEYNDNEMDYNTIQWYNDTIVYFFEKVKNEIIQKDEHGKIVPVILTFDDEAKKEWIRIFNGITKNQNSENENEYMKSMLPKQKSYIPRFSLLIHIFNGVGLPEYDFEKVSKESVLNAEKLSKYFIAMAKKIKIDSIENSEIKKVLKNNDGKSNKEKFIILYKANPKLNKNEVAEQLGVSLQMIYKYIKALKK
tara:strand:- start:135 stop:2417 length:2283 start_codon:yes stop_codon:yes gene_type:complete